MWEDYQNPNTLSTTKSKQKQIFLCRLASLREFRGAAVKSDTLYKWTRKFLGMQCGMLWNSNSSPTVWRWCMFIRPRKLFLKDWQVSKTRRGSPNDRRHPTAEAPPIGKIQPFSKITVTLEPVMQIRCPLRFRISFKKIYIVYFMTKSTIFNH